MPRVHSQLWKTSLLLVLGGVAWLQWSRRLIYLTPHPFEFHHYIKLRHQQQTFIWRYSINPLPRLLCHLSSVNHLFLNCCSNSPQMHMSNKISTWKTKTSQLHAHGGTHSGDLFCISTHRYPHHISFQKAVCMCVWAAYLQHWERGWSWLWN